MTVVGTALRDALHTLKLSGTSETLHTRLAQARTGKLGRPDSYKSSATARSPRREQALSEGTESPKPPRVTRTPTWPLTRASPTARTFK